MWSTSSNTKSNVQKKGGGHGLVAVAIDKDKGSQNALKWASENLLSRGQSVILIHVIKPPPSTISSYINHLYDLWKMALYGQANGSTSPRRKQLEKMTKDLFLPFHCFCTRKDIQCLDVILEDTDVVKALTEYVSYASIENLALGSPSRNGFLRFRTTSSVPSSISKRAPDFCTVYVISKGKISSVKNATRQATYTSPILDQIENLNKQPADDNSSETQSTKSTNFSKPAFRPRNLYEEDKSPYCRGGKGLNGKMYGDMSETDTDISFVSSGRPSSDLASSLLFDSTDSNRTSRVSTSSSQQSVGSIQLGYKMFDSYYQPEFSSASHDTDRTSSFSTTQGMDDVETEMKRLKLELKQTMDMYSAACKEALTARQKAVEMQQWRLDEEGRMEEARQAEDVALSIADTEAHKKMNIFKEPKEPRKALMTDIRYRRYSIEEIEAATDMFSESRKIGEGGYGPVYKCRLDHTPVAVKVLRPDAAQGRTQFNQEVEVLSCIRHPNMVLLLGACPEYGCLVYEYMANGSLEDLLARKRNTPVLSWQLRFRISAEIVTGLLFLHQTKPEPLVHRDLKPGNILLDNNLVSKISDVGLARLIPATAESETHCHVTSTAGTFYYIDPEYQQTGMLGVKSDVYSLGIVLLQVITAKPAMGLSHCVERSIKNGTFYEMLDPAVTDWPGEEVMCFAKLALRCAQMRRKDRPDLGKEVLPELNRLRDIAEENMSHVFLGGTPWPSPYNSYVSSTQDSVSSEPGASGKQAGRTKLSLQKGYAGGSRF